MFTFFGKNNSLCIQSNDEINARDIEFRYINDCAQKSVSMLLKSVQFRSF